MSSRDPLNPGAAPSSSTAPHPTLGASLAVGAFAHALQKRAHSVKPLVDNGDGTKWTTLAPRRGEFSVDSADWWQELRRDPFHSCSNLPVIVLLLVYLLIYYLGIMLLAVVLYAIAQALDDPDQPHAIVYPDGSFGSCVQAAWESLTTVGYGSAYPNSFWSSAVTATMTVVSLVYDAVGIGIFYQRLSNASIKARSIEHSSVACVCRAQKARAMPMRLECRVHHVADHAFVDPSCKLIIAAWRSGQDGTGRVCVEFRELAVGNRSGGQVTPMMAALQFPWSVVHYIDEASPLREYVGERGGPGGEPEPSAAFLRDHVEIICLALGTAASTGNTSESRASYTCHSLRFGHRFADALHFCPADRSLKVDLSQLSATLPEDPEDLLLPQCF